jgi:hypothetical protein
VDGHYEPMTYRVQAPHRQSAKSGKCGGKDGAGIPNARRAAQHHEYDEGECQALGKWSGPRPGGLTLRLRGSWGTEVRGWSSLVPRVGRRGAA